MDSKVRPPSERFPAQLAVKGLLVVHRREMSAQIRGSSEIFATIGAFVP